jgi:hypothetical protein
VSARGEAPPWHLWGHDLNVQAQTPAAGGTTTSFSQQLVRIDYARPETWFFIFSCIAADVQGAAATLDIFFDLNLGAGRSVIVIAGFEHYTFQLPADSGKQIWTSQVQAPKRNAAETVPNFMQTVSAQSLNVVARAVLQSAGAAQVNAQVSAMFSPSTHVRPEWYSGQFPGDEDKGK